jgi:thioester reductase-like protein
VLAEHSVEGIDAALLDSRVVVWPADLALPSLGLAPGAFDSLAGSVSAIYHCGAVVNWLHPYETLRAPNVLGTLALLQLSTHTHTRTAHTAHTAHAQARTMG